MRLLLLVVVAVLFMLSVGEAGAATCGNINRNTGGIRAYGVGCQTARKVAKAWNGESSYSAYGFRCRYRDTGYEAGKISCRKGSARIVFYTGA
jgi:hypothetical protein